MGRRPSQRRVSGQRKRCPGKAKARAGVSHSRDGSVTATESVVLRSALAARPAGPRVSGGRQARGRHGETCGRGRQQAKGREGDRTSYRVEARNGSSKASSERHPRPEQVCGGVQGRRLREPLVPTVFLAARCERLGLVVANNRRQLKTADGAAATGDHLIGGGATCVLWAGRLRKGFAGSRPCAACSSLGTASAAVSRRFDEADEALICWTPGRLLDCLM